MPKQPKRPTIDELRKALPERERRTIPLAAAGIELRQTEGEDPKISMGIPYKSYSVDMGFREQIAPGAFSVSIAHRSKASPERNKDIVSLWNHDPNWVLGRQANGTLQFSDSDQFLDSVVTLDGEDVMHRHFARRVERRDVQGSSFGFEKIKDEWEDTDEGPVRTLIEVRLYDVSPVTFPAYPDSQAERRSVLDVASVRSGVDVTEFAAILEHVQDGKVPAEAREKFLSWLTRFQGMTPPPPAPPPDWERKMKLHGRYMLRAVTKSIDDEEHPREDFAYAPGDNVTDWKFPIFDASHAQNALSRWNQAEGIPADQKDDVLDKILAACKKFNIDTTEFEKMHGMQRNIRLYKRPTDGKTYATFEACVADNQWADNPEGFCAGIKIAGEG